MLRSLGGEENERYGVYAMGPLDAVVDWAQRNGYVHVSGMVAGSKDAEVKVFSAFIFLQKQE